MGRPRKDQTENQEVKKAKKESNDFRASFLKNWNNPNLVTLDESINSNVSDFISTGSLSLNKIISGSYNKGIPNNKIIIIAGPSGTFKTAVCGRICANAQAKDYTIAYIDSEFALDNQTMKNMGAKPEEFIHIQIQTISDFQNTAYDLMTKWRENPETSDKPLMIIADSLGGMAGSKETNDMIEGKHASDMGQRAKEFRKAARTLTGAAGKYNIPIICTNHTYEQAAANPQAAPIIKMTGGEGFYYAASAIILLRKREIKEATTNALGDNIKVKTGNIIIATTQKNRLIPEGLKAEMYVDFTKGIIKYYGLLEDAAEFGFIEKRGPRYYIKHLDKTVFEKDLYSQEVFKPIIDDLNKKVEEKYKFNNVEIDMNEFEEGIKKEDNNSEKVDDKLE